MMKLKSKRFCRSFSISKLSSSGNNNKIKGGGGDQAKEVGGGGGINNNYNNMNNNGEIKWERRPGGMLVQMRETTADGQSSDGEGMITVRVSTVSQWHHISIESTSTFGELKMILSLVSGMEAREQRLLFKGKERGDGEYLHMVGVRDKDKVLLLQDPAIKEMKLLQRIHGINGPSTCRTISV